VSAPFDGRRFPFRACGDDAGIDTGTRIVTGTDLMDGSGLTGPTIPSDLRSVRRGSIHIAVIGANTVVLPDVTIGEGAIVGAGAVVTKSLEPWTINVGQPARPVRDRPSAEVLAREATLRAPSGA
jgi:acetyltransferase-like isoleucine patch superfamily enzyme